ncbi:hypothetical protein GR183_18595 [Stappia sp. GBMRC 2046]|uniref:Neurotransmitter-gated ion-channel ligand-binding domain-containing protein n=1 Tax=Stappia sediminis TaxID=2692190 RepID=A0A7X3LXI2_9HYPH|nr:hypothetical protein [Stappia sediminis]MXN66927.1 hypothetical protein [Stappia sediminis]
MRAPCCLLGLITVLTGLFLVTPSFSRNIDELEALVRRNAPENPIRIAIGIRINQIEFVDQKAENFGAVGTLRMEWQDPKLAFEPEADEQFFRVFTPEGFWDFTQKNRIYYPSFTFQNQQRRRFVHQAGFAVLPDGKAFYFEQFSAVMQAPNFDFRKFPFDTQKFFIHVTLNRPAGHAEFVPIENFSRLGDLLGEEEWILTDVHTEVGVHEGFTGLPSSRFSFGFDGYRHLDYYAVRIFLPLFVFAFVTWATFFLEDYRKRIDIAAGNLLIFVAFNFAISGDLPRLGYMTFLDFILIAMFIVTALMIVFNVALRHLEAKGRTEFAKRIDLYTLRWIYPISYFFVVLFAAYRFLYTTSEV